MKQGTETLPISELFKATTSLADGSTFFSCLICDKVGPVEIGKHHSSDCPLSVEKSNYRNLRKILRHDWNPIGFDRDLPENEYDSYVPQIWELLTEDADVMHVASTLGHIREKLIGIRDKEGIGKERDLEVATKIRELYEKD